MPNDWSDRILISDLSDEPALSDELTSIHERISQTDEASTQDVVLNFAAVTYLNSSNIAQLLRLRTTLMERRHELRFCSVGNEVWSLMLLTGLEKVFQFAPDPASAIASLQLSYKSAEEGAGE